MDERATGCRPIKKYVVFALCVLSVAEPVLSDFDGPPEVIPDIIYVVERGDTLYAISERYEMSVSDLRQKNNLASDALAIGQILTLNEQPPPQKVVEAIEAPEPIKVAEIIEVSEKTNVAEIIEAPEAIEVAEAETLEVPEAIEIAEAIEVPEVIEVIEVPEVIEVADAIEVPALRSTHVVKSGETLYSIAQDYQTSVDDLRLKNNLEGDALVIGEVLKVAGQLPASKIHVVLEVEPTVIKAPEAQAPEVIEALEGLIATDAVSTSDMPAPRLTPNIQHTLAHVVEPGDTLYSISRRYEMSISDLRQKNNLQGDALAIGQIIALNDQEASIQYSAAAVLPQKIPPAAAPITLPIAKLAQCPEHFLIKSNRLLSDLVEEYLVECGATLQDWLSPDREGITHNYRFVESAAIDMPQGIKSLTKLLRHYSISLKANEGRDYAVELLSSKTVFIQAN